MLSWINYADAAQEIATTAETPGLGVRNLLTESPAEVWRLPSITQAMADTALPVDSLAGATLGANTTRVGSADDPFGGTSGVIYESASTASSFIRAAAAFSADPALTYRVGVWARRITTGGTQQGSLIRVAMSGGFVRSLGNAAAGLTTEWAYFTLEFTPLRAGNASIDFWLGANAGQGQIALFGATVQQIARNTYLDVTLPAAEQVGVLALIAPRDGVLAAHSVQVSASAVGAGLSDALSLPQEPLALAANRGAWWHWPASPFTARWFRFVLSGPTATAGEYLQLGRLWIGNDFRPRIGVEPAGYRRGWRDAGAVDRAQISGITTAARGSTFRSIPVGLPMLSDDEADQLEACAAYAGNTRQVLMNARTDRGARDLVLGKLVGDPPSPAAIAPSLYRCDISIAEDL